MKYIFNLIITTIILAGSLANAAPVTTSSDKELQATYQDIQSTLGIVPTFMKAYPEAGLPAAWEEFKNVQLSKNTMLSGKQKELIGLAVSSQIPCKYCAYFHTEAAKLNGATQTEMKEAVAMAAATRHWATIIEGNQLKDAEFDKEIENVIAFMRKEKERPVKEQVAEKPAAADVFNAKTAYQDIEKTFGSVPSLFRQFPENSIAGAWKMLKSVQLNPETSISAKDKELIALAVGAQVPCKHCIHFDTEAAKLNGASTEEIRETLAMAAQTRFWSTVINGSQMDEAKFKRETNQILRYVKSQTKRVGMK